MKRKLKIGSLFSGSGCWELAAQMCGIKPAWAAEIEPFPIAVTKQRFPNMKHLGSVTNINGTEVEPVDVITSGSPCFVAGTMITTRRGLVPIEQIQIGDEVLTHTGRFRPVLDSQYTGNKSTVRVKGMGIDWIQVTPNHPFYVRHRYREWDNSIRRDVRRFTPAEWRAIKDCTTDYYLGAPINSESENPLGLTAEECYLIGRYIADGYVRDEQRPDRPVGSTYANVVFCIGKAKSAEFATHILSHKYGMAKEKTVDRYTIHCWRLMGLCSQCGKGAINKRFPAWAINLPEDLLKHMIDGFMAGDGCYTQGKFSVTSISRELVYTLAQAVSKVYHCAYSIYENKVASTAVIEGRVVNQHTQYQLTYKTDKRKQDKAFFEDGYVWFPIQSIELADVAPVYNLSVASDQSYCAQNVAVHNCQDLSLAGKRAGLKHVDLGAEETTRSGLFMEGIRIIKEMRNATGGKYPAFATWENVPGAFSSNRGEDFRIVIEEFARIADSNAHVPRPAEWRDAGAVMGDGWSVAWRVLDSKFWGVPQRRRRIFLVADFGNGGGSRLQRYYLSAKACIGILRRASERGKKLPEILTEALIRQSETMAV